MIRLLPPQAPPPRYRHCRPGSAKIAEAVRKRRCFGGRVRCFILPQRLVDELHARIAALAQPLEHGGDVLFQGEGGSHASKHKLV